MSEMPALGPGCSMGARCCRREREKRNTSEMTLSQPFEPLEPLIMFCTIRAQLLIDDAESVPTEIKYIRSTQIIWSIQNFNSVAWDSRNGGVTCASHEISGNTIAALY
ncbi:hypothetical protein B0H11DRAFT_1909167 [Mycena galericulata]|nr:hypothetical protein B0H11DRAFT_1909167 [Mycena galericulata]